MGSIRTVILIEDPADIPAALSHGRGQGDDTLLVPLSPSASCRLDQGNIPFRNIQSYAGGDDIHSIGLENYRRIGHLFLDLEPRLGTLHGIPTLEPARYSLFQLKILIDVLCTSITLVQRIIRQEQPDLLCIPRRQFPPGCGRGPVAGNGAPVFPAVLSLDGWNVPIEFLEEGSPPSCRAEETGEHPSRGRPLRRWVASRDSLFNLGILLARRRALDASWAYFRSLFGKPGGPVLICGNGYNWDDALVELYRGGWRPIHWIPPGPQGTRRPLPQVQQAVEESLREDKHFGELIPFHSIDTGAYLSEHISTIVSNSVSESQESYRQTRNLIAEKGIRAFLVSARSRPADHAAVQAARDAGIPVISWQHGGAGYAVHPMMPCLECYHSDLHLVFGTPVATQYRQAMEGLGWKERPPLAAVGSSSLDAIEARVSGGNDMGEDGPVLYVTTAYLRNVYYTSLPQQLIGWDDRLWQVQRKVIDLAERFSEREFIIKLHPAHRSGEPLKSWIHENGISNIRCISTEALLEDLLPVSSLILFDLVSTGILQALLTQKPVFLYSGLYQLEADVNALLKKRVFISDHQDEFIRAVSGHLGRTPETRLPPFDSREFITAYGLHRDDGMAATRAVSLVARMVRGPLPPPPEDGAAGA